ncbi:MAG: IclR family transcriptional regulator [Alicyclobacillaceae bacterium]|nr:IclR family transcriptional regulator [Alicyclobacillaceae bacterium]
MRELHVEVSRCVERTVRILDCFSFERPMQAIDDIVRCTGLPKTTVYRILWTLEKNGLIHYDERDNRYRLGFKLLEYGGIVLQNLDIRREAEPFLEELQRETECLVLLAVRQGDTFQYVLRLDSDDDFQPQSYLGRRRVLHYGIIGRMLMAYLPRDEVRQIVEVHPLEASTPDTIVEEEAFYAQLDEMRRRGYGVDVGGTFPGFTGISAPVFGPGQEVVAAIGIAAPTFRLETKEALEGAIAKVVRTARQISRRMGGATDEPPVQG